MPAKKKTTRTTNSAKAVVKKTSLVRKTSTKKQSKKVHASSIAMTSTKIPVRQAVKSYLRNPRLWVGVGVVVVAVLLFFYKGLFVAATVNGQPISRLSVVSELEKQSGKQVLSNLVVESLVKQEAQKRHITVSQEELDGQLKKIEDQLKGQGVTLDDALAMQGLSRSDLTNQLELEQMLSKMVGSSVKVSDADIQKYIDANKDSLPTNLSDSELKAQVKSQLEQQDLQQKEQTFIAGLQKNAKINYFVSY